MFYKEAGVDISKKQSLLTNAKRLCSEIGRFGGGFPFDGQMLVASVDGVGTKLLIADSLESYRTVGEDIVNHCVNDILCEGARPLFFMDYIGFENLNEKVFLELIHGISEGCRKNRITLIGGETAELPSIYHPGRYDLVGFIVGLVNERITGDDIREGDILIGLPSRGLHTNGYSLVRKIIKEKNLSLDEYIPEFGHTLGEELLRVHRSYIDLLSPFPPFSPSRLPAIKGIIHITGGGFYGNIPRVIPAGYGVTINKSSWDIPPVFRFIKEKGDVPENEMYRVFNMGIGMILIVDKRKSKAVLDEIGEAKVIGMVTSGSGVEFE